MGVVGAILVFLESPSIMSRELHGCDFVILRHKVSEILKIEYTYFFHWKFNKIQKLLFFNGNWISQSG